MYNPWLKIPASDYEGHMGNPKVNQLSFIEKTFKRELEKHKPTKVAVLGCTTGNGLEHINNEYTKKVDVFDINPEYLSILQNRFKNTIRGLEIKQVNLEHYNLPKNEYSFILAGLIFEYLNPQALLNNIANALKSNGILLSILQQPTEGIRKVSETQYSSLKTLDSIMKLIPDKDFRLMTLDSNLEELESYTITLESGKSFFIGKYKKKS